MEQELTPEESKQSFSEGYNKAYQELLAQGYQPRKARSYLDSVAKKNLKKMLKGFKQRVKNELSS